jgi:hypothetical protein
MFKILGIKGHQKKGDFLFTGMCREFLFALAKREAQAQEKHWKPKTAKAATVLKDIKGAGPLKVKR